MAPLPDFTVSVLALAFAVMGIGSLVAPMFVSQQFGEALKRSSEGQLVQCIRANGVENSA